MKQATCRLCAAFLALSAFAEGVSRAAAGPPMVWVAEGLPPAPILVPAEDPSGEVHKAAEELAGYVEKISGQRPEVIQGAPQPLPERAVWVGYQPALDALFPDLDFKFAHPEEILIAAVGQHLVIAGRDRDPYFIGPPLTYGRVRVGEFGTANAVSTFIHEQLGVRWLWPGELGTDIPRRSRIAFEPFSYRFHPPICSRRFRLEPRYARTDQGKDVAAVNYFWENAHRANRRSSHILPRDHAYNDWSEKYRATHPDFFALQPDGKRAQGREVKLCVSNPDVARQWLDNAEVLLRENPGLVSLGATPNDGGGWCVCENCRAMDHPQAPRGVLTERYVKYWNSLARGLRERMPGREVFLDMLAYAVYKAPPIETRLEDGIAVTFVGHYPLCTEAEWRQTQADMRGWKDAGTCLIGYRPNMHWYDGGFWGMPSVAMAKTHGLFNLLAEIRCHAFEVDSILMFSATQGPQHYLMARLAYDPAADGWAILRDFYVRGFGPAANDVQAYYELLEAAHSELVENPAWRISSAARFEHLDLLRKVHTPERIEQARAVLERARACAEAAGTDPVYARRVAFVRSGLEFVSLNMEAAGHMERVRRSKGGDRDAVQKALAVCARRDALLKSSPPFAIDVTLFQQRIVAPQSPFSRRMGDYLGPPREEYIRAEAVAPPRKLAAAQYWREEFSDTFNRAEPGPAWQVLSGAWSVRDGLLTASGNRVDNYILLAQPLSDLQRIEFVVAATPPGSDGEKSQTAADVVCDLTAVLHASPSDPLAGYAVQYGARFNQAHVIRRARSQVAILPAAGSTRIVPGRFYTVVAEFDGRHVRLTVEGEKVLEFEEEAPLLGPGHDRIGLYSHTPMQVRSVKVFTAEARPAEFFDDPDTH